MEGNFCDKQGVARSTMENILFNEHFFEIHFKRLRQFFSHLTDWKVNQAVHEKVIVWDPFSLNPFDMIDWNVNEELLQEN